jgi:hypothetical protein
MKVVARFFTIAAGQQTTGAHMKSLLILFCNVRHNNGYIVTPPDVTNLRDLQHDHVIFHLAATMCTA